MFQARVKGQRYDPTLIPFPCAPETFDQRELFDYSDEANPKMIGTFEIYGAGKNSYGHDTELLCVTLNDGTKVPAFRVSADAKNWCICQNKSLKAIYVS